MVKELDATKVSIALIQVLKEGKKDDFCKIINELPAYDVAQQYKHLPKKHRHLFLEYLEPDQLAQLLRYLTPDEQRTTFQLIGPERSMDIVEVMKHDDLTLLLNGLPKKEVEGIINRMKQDQSHFIRQILAYPKKSAGRVMMNRYVWVHQSYTVDRAVKKLQHFPELADNFNYVYVINDQKQLVGVVSYKSLLLAEREECIGDIMVSDVMKVDVLTKQEDVAKLFARYDFVTMPVVEEDGTLVGVITSDDVLDIVVREANEDIEMLLASGKAIDFRTKPMTAAIRRLPWLILLLFIGLVSGSIISGFEDTLQAVVALAFFMPMIAGMTGNTGTQSLAVVVRGLVSEDLTLKKALKLIFRELIVGIIIGLTCAILIAIIAYVWQGDLILGLVVGSSLLLTLIIGTLAGTVIPLILYKFKVDPAVASGPLITTINDILSLLIYFGIATMFLSKLS